MSTFKELGDRFLARFKRAHSSRASYLSALASALYGLPPDLVANTLASFAHRFIEGSTGGLSEQQVAAGLPDPRQVAAQCRAELHGSAFNANRNLPNLWRLLISLLGLCILNLFLTVPAIVFGALLFAFYCAALALYVAGIAVTAGAVAGVSEVTISGQHPLTSWAESGPIRIDIDAAGVSIHGKAAHDSATHGAEMAQDERDSGGIALSHAGSDFSRGQQGAAGIGLIAGAILMLLAALVVSKYAAIGLKRYILMNYSLLRNA